MKIIFIFTDTPLFYKSFLLNGKDGLDLMQYIISVVQFLWSDFCEVASF